MAKADLKNTAFKVGDEVVCVGRPFELHEIIKQYPGSGERQYRIGPPRIRSKDVKAIKKASEERKQRDVAENELMRLDEALDELLDFARAKRNHATRNALLVALQCARIDYDRLTKKLPPAELVRSLEKSVTTTRKLLAELTKYGIPTEIEHHVCKVDAGVVDVLPLPFEAPKTFRMFQFSPPFEGTAVVVIQNLLRSWHDTIKMVPRKKREGQRKEYKTAIVEHAVQFSCPHSSIDPSTDPKNPLWGFVEQFYRRVTGTEPDGSFEYQVRAVLPRITADYAHWRLIAQKVRSNA
jgi:hypothetical protein